MTKRILAIIIATLMAVSMFSISAGAVGTASGDEFMTATVLTDKENYSVGDDVTVSIKVANNYNATCLRFPVMYDSSVYEMPTLLTVSGVNTCATNGKVEYNSTNAETYIPENYSADEFGCILVQWSGTVVGGKFGCVNNPDGEICFTFNLKIKSDAAGKTGTILIPSESTLFYDQAMNDPADATTIYYLKDTCDNTFVDANATVNSAEDVALVPVDGTTAIVDDDNLVVYGLKEGLVNADAIMKFVKPTGGSTIKCTPAEYGFGTGTSIELQLNGETIKTYKVLIYGDLDGDSTITGLDLSILISAVTGLIKLDDELIIKAADVFHDSLMDPLDVSPQLSAISGIITIDQTAEYFE